MSRRIGNEKAEQQEIEDNWNGIWKEILEKPDGSIDKEQLKKELFDYHEMIGRMTTLTCRLTKDRLSYPTYPVETILEVHDEVQRQEYEDNLGCPVCGTEKYSDD